MVARTSPSILTTLLPEGDPHVIPTLPRLGYQIILVFKLEIAMSGEDVTQLLRRTPTDRKLARDPTT